MKTGNNQNSDHSEYIRLLVNNQARISTYIQSLVQNYQDAEDIFQDVATIAWEKFSEYDPGSNFTAWVITIARYKIMQYWQNNKRNIVCYSDSTLKLLEQYIASDTQTISNDKRYLHQCLQKLPEPEINLIRQRYSKKMTIKSIAEKMGRSLHGLYSTMSRIHVVLADCIQRQKSAGERL